MDAFTSALVTNYNEKNLIDRTQELNTQIIAQKQTSAPNTNYLKVKYPVCSYVLLCTLHSPTYR